MGIAATQARLIALTNRTTNVERLQEALTAQETKPKNKYEEEKEKYKKIEDTVTISDEAEICYEHEKNVVNKNENEEKYKSIKQVMNGKKYLLQKNINKAYGVFTK